MLHVENIEEAAQIERLISESWQRVAGNTEDYPGDRGLRLYYEALPKFQGKAVVEHIKERAIRGAETITVLDIGCGQALFLAGLIKDCPQVRAIGLTAADYRSEAPRPWRPYIKKVDYRVGDAHKLTEVMGDINPDFIVSINAFYIFVDSLSVLQQAYDLSADNAIIFIDHAKMLLTSDEAKQLESIWQEHGINANLERWSPHPDVKSLYSLAIQKSAHTRLPLPFRYNFEAIGYPPREYIFVNSSG